MEMSYHGIHHFQSFSPIVRWGADLSSEGIVPGR
jgi:hypothetical protein